MDSLVFNTILVLVVEESGSPLVPVLLLQVLDVHGVSEVNVLLQNLKWLESLLIPLFDSDAQLVLSKAVQHIHKLTQSVVTLLVKSAVVVELVHRVLFPHLDHGFKARMQNFIHNQLGVMHIVRLHLSSFSADFHHTIVISAVQLVQFILQVVSL